MTGTICSIASCKSNSKRAKKEGEVIRFFTFPKKPEILKQWVRVCRRNGKSPFDPKNKRICSKHFALDQYEDKIEAQINKKLPKKLKETAIPSLNLQLVPEKTINISKTSKRMKSNEEKRKSLLLTDDLILKQNNLPQDNNMPACSSNSDLQNKSSREILFQKYIALQEQCEKLKSQAEQDREKMENLIAANKKLQRIVDQCHCTAFKARKA